MTRTKRWLCGLLGATLLATAFPLAAQAQSVEPPVVRAGDVDNGARLQSVKDRIGAEIEKRLTALDRLTNRVETADHLTAAHSTALLADFETAARILTSGLDAVNAATSLEELRETARPIFEETLVFALLVPKTRAVIASDLIVAIAARHDEAAQQLQADLDRLAAAGIDVGDAQANLDEAIRIVADVAVAAAPVADSVIGLQPGDEIGAPLAEAMAALRGTRGRLHEARRLTHDVAAFIRSQARPGTGE